MSQPTPREEEIFDALLAQSPEQRGPFLDRACAGDAALRALVEELWRAHESAGALLDVSPRLESRPGEEQLGERIGRYKLLQKIGEGGCGVVYMAEQQDVVQRRVALKVIKLGMDTKAVIARFEAERQALARMDHANIAHVIDAGSTGSGRPYFVMELVRGQKITTYCDQNNLSTVERLELFIKVCEAIQHAHQKGIIHRDIKPSNILVTLHDGVPVPKIIDFGIAKATQGRLTDQTLFTAFEQFMGTPAYVSPEQAEMSGLDIDTRSDIYALGVLLYELLTGRTPFDTKELVDSGLDEMRRRIREVEPPRPSARLRTLSESDRTTIARRRRTEGPKLTLQLRGDLDWIVMRCLEKDRARRYDTAHGLALDVRRYLDSEPVLARPPSTTYLITKLIRRHRLAFAAGGVIAALLLVGFVSSTRLYLLERQHLERARDAEQKAKDALRTALEQKRLADDARTGEIKEAARHVLAAKFAQDTINDLSLLAAVEENTKGFTRILDQAAERLRRQPQDEPEIPDFYDALGLIYVNVRAFPQAEAMFAQALTLRRQRPGPPQADVAQSLNYLGVVLALENKLDDAKARHLEALALYRTLYGDEHATIAKTLSNLSAVLGQMGQVADAEQMARNALALQRKLAPDNADVVESLKRLGSILVQDGRLAEGEAPLREALAVSRRVFGNDHIQVASALNFLAVTCAIESPNNPPKITEAIDYYREAVAIRERVKGSFSPSSPAPTPKTLAEALSQPGTLAEVENLLREARRFAHAQYAEGSWEDAAYIALIAWVLLYEEKYEEAEPFARDCFEYRRRLRPDDWSTFHAMHMVGAALGGQKKFAEAETLLIDGYNGLRQREASIPDAHRRRIPEALDRLAKFYTAWKKPARAKEYQRELEGWLKAEATRTVSSTLAGPKS